MSEWISVEERLPDKNKPVIAADRFGEVFEATYGFGRWTPAYDEYETAAVTHWMPLPSPPGEEVDSDASDN